MFQKEEEKCNGISLQNSYGANETKDEISEELPKTDGNKVDVGETTVSTPFTKLLDCGHQFIITYTAQLVFLFFKAGETMIDTGSKLLIYDSVCLREFPKNSCMLMHIDLDIENEVQEYSANFIMFHRMLLSIPAILLGLLCGAWSDKIGRKIPACIPCVGTIISAVLAMPLIWQRLPQHSTLPRILCAATIRGFCGKSVAITMAVHSYVSDTSSTSERTTRLGLLLGMNYIGNFIGSLLVGVAMDVSGYDALFATIIGLDLLSLTLAIVFMKSSVPEEEEQGINEKIVHFFNKGHVKESIAVLLQPRQNKQRYQLVVFFAALLVFRACQSGEIDVTLLFVTRHPLSFSDALYGYLFAANYISLSMILLVILPLVVKYTGLGDSPFVLIGSAFKMLQVFILALSIKPWMAFAAYVVGSPSAILITSLKSLISKTVTLDEIGKIFALLSSGETIFNLLGSIIFTQLYAWTPHKFTWLLFIMEGVVFAIGIIWLGWLFYMPKCRSYGRLIEDDDTQSHYGSRTSSYSDIQKVDTLPPGYPRLYNSTEDNKESFITDVTGQPMTQIQNSTKALPNDSGQGHNVSQQNGYPYAERTQMHNPNSSHENGKIIASDIIEMKYRTNHE